MKNYAFLHQHHHGPIFYLFSMCCGSTETSIKDYQKTVLPLTYAHATLEELKDLKSHAFALKSKDSLIFLSFSKGNLFYNSYPH